MSDAGLTPFAAFYFASALAQACVGLVVFLHAPARLPNRFVGALLALGTCLAITRGIQSMLGFVAPWTSLALDFSFPGSNLVLLLALRYPHDYVRSPRGRIAWRAALALVVLASLDVVLWKQPFYVLSPKLHVAYPWGFLADNVDYFVSNLATMLLLGYAYARQPVASRDTAAPLMLAAFGMGIVVATPSLLTVYNPLAAMNAGPLNNLDILNFACYFAGGLATLGAMAWVLHLVRREGRPVGWLLAWWGGLFALGTFLASPGARATPTITAFSAFGEPAILAVRPFLLAYAILRHQMFDIDVRLKRGLTVGFLTVGLVAVFVPVEELVRLLVPLPPATALAIGIASGIVVTLVAYARIQAAADGMGERILSRLHLEDAAYAAQKQRELYSVALERALGPDGRPTPHGRDELVTMRAQLGITDLEHEALLADAIRRSRDGVVRVEPGLLLAGRYRILAKLGEGGSGGTYRARDTRLEREVALKVVPTGDPATRERAAREARLLASVHHPRVVAIHDVLDLREHIVLVMELVEGGSLAQRIARGRIEPDEARRVLRDVLEGLDAIHAAGLVHRDVKPANVLLEADGRAKVADLGIAHRDRDGTGTSLKGAGTLAYMAPEQILELDSDARTDVYAVGAVLYEMLSGATYVREAAREGVIAQEAIVSRAVSPPPSAPDWARGFLHGSLAKQPDARYRDARLALAALT